MDSRSNRISSRSERRRPNGQRRPRSLLDADRDHPERQQADEERLRIALDAAHLGTWTFDLQTDEVSGDDRARDIFGLNRNHLRFEEFLPAVHPEDRDAVAQAVREAISPRGSGSYHREHRVVWPDGSLRWVAVDGAVQFQGQGAERHAVRFIGTVLDITERRQAEASLRASHAILERVLSAQTFGVLFFGLDGRLRGANQALLEMTGYSREEFLAITDWHQLNPPEFGDITARAADELASRGKTLPYEKQWLRKDGSRFWGLFAPAILGGAGREAQCIEFIIDITDRKEAEAALRAAKDELARTNQQLDSKIQERTAKLGETVAELEGFSYSLVHDLRAPLRAMSSYASILEREAGPRLEQEQVGLLRKIGVAANRMDQLVIDSLNYGKILRQDLPVRAVNLTALLRGMVETYPNLHPPQAEVSLELGELTVRGNEAALTQVFSNLLGNAVKFVAPGVHPRVRVWAEAPAPLTAQPAVRVFIEDNGIGIPNEAHKRIFGMFERLHAAHDYPGTGIGLALVKKSLERTGGRVSLESAPGKGSRFCVQLPLAKEGVKAAHPRRHSEG